MSRKISKDGLSPRAIDALVAEHVMGYETDSYKDNFKSNVGWFSIDDWCPSTDIAAAWEVVEKMGESGLFVSVGNTLSGLYVCITCKPNDRKSTIETVSESAPMAICLAALKAKGINYSD